MLPCGQQALRVAGQTGRLSHPLCTGLDLSLLRRYLFLGREPP